jgi:alanyl-tRNA synthetase
MEVARTEGIVVSGTWREEFDAHMAAQRARSRGVAPGRA